MFFKNKSVLVTYDPKLDKKQKDSTAEDKILRPETVNLVAEKTKEVAKYVALIAVGAYATVKAIDTVSQIAVKKTKSADNE